MSKRSSSKFTREKSALII
nr:unnamed protein product [Callosobruchus analis]